MSFARTVVFVRRGDGELCENIARSEEYIGALLLHCGLLKAAKLHAGINKHVGPTCHKRMFGEKPFSELTVVGMFNDLFNCLFLQSLFSSSRLPSF